MMAETDHTTFRSNLKKEQNRNAGGTRDRRRIFEDGCVNSNSSTYSGSSTSQYSRASDRTDSPSGRTTLSITSRINKLRVNDDSKDDEEVEKEVRKEEDIDNKKSPRKYGGSSISDRVSKSVGNDEDFDDDNEEEQAAPKKGLKKPRGATSSSANKRKERKHLREKRRSTGVVIMPGQPVAPGDEEEQMVRENTAKNMGEDEATDASSVSDAKQEAVAKQNEQYIEELKDELANAHRELEQLHNANMRLKDENRALLRVVASLSGTGRC